MSRFYNDHHTIDYHRTLARVPYKTKLKMVVCSHWLVDRFVSVYTCVHVCVKRVRLRVSLCFIKGQLGAVCSPSDS